MAVAQAPAFWHLRQVARAYRWIQKCATVVLLPILIWFGLDRRRMEIDYEAEKKKVELANARIESAVSSLTLAEMRLSNCRGELNRAEDSLSRLRNFHVLIQQASVKEILKLRRDPSIY